MRLKSYFIIILATMMVISCKKETCTDGVQNQSETGVDCGGSCIACATCSDGIQNQGETGVDCGGPCSACYSTLCDGVSSTSYMPLESGSIRMLAVTSGSGFNETLEVLSTTQTYGANTYKRITWSEGGFNSATLYYRMDTNGDVYFYWNSLSQEYLLVPASPTVGQELYNEPSSLSPIRRVSATGVTVTTSYCTYTGCVEIEVIDQNGSVNHTEYFARGVGQVKEIGGWGTVSELESFTL